MGADLIGYFAKGPRKLPKRAMPAAEAEADRRLDWLRRVRPALEGRDDQALIGLLADCPWLDPAERSPRPANIDLEELHGQFRHLLNLAGDIRELTGQKAVREFVRSWPPRTRDAAHIVDPDIPGNLIVFAGERTWGDPPEGEGFRLLAQAGILGVAAILGVWVEAAFFSLHIPLARKGKADAVAQS